jgi:hypothetical protein
MSKDKDPILRRLQGIIPDGERSSLPRFSGKKEPRHRRRGSHDFPQPESSSLQAQMMNRYASEDQIDESELTPLQIELLKLNSSSPKRDAWGRASATAGEITDALNPVKRCDPPII